MRPFRHDFADASLTIPRVHNEVPITRGGGVANNQREPIGSPVKYKETSTAAALVSKEIKKNLRTHALMTQTSAS